MLVEYLCTEIQVYYIFFVLKRESTAMKLSNIYSDKMIIQQNKKNRIEGYSNANDTIKLCFDDCVFEGRCNAAGFFSIELAPMSPGGPHTIKISDNSDSIIINDVYVGDVFLLAGQSNMELPVNRTLDLYRKEVTGINYPLIRMFQLPKEPKFGEPDETLVTGEWIDANEKDVMAFSALGFYFARMKYDNDNIPVGLVHAAVGGTHIEAFMSEEGLLKSADTLIEKAKKEGRKVECVCVGKNDSCKACYKEIIERNKNEAYVLKTVKDDEDNAKAWGKKNDADDIGLSEKWYDHEWSDEEKKDALNIKVPQSWLNNSLKDRIGTVWVQRSVDVPENFCNREVELRLGTIVDADVTYVNGVEVGRTEYFYPPRRYKLKPGVLKPGKNIITVRVIINNNVGEFKEDMPYCIKADEKEIPLDGIWSARPTSIEKPMGDATFFTWHPTALYNKMIYPIRNIAFDAVFYYQGESNTFNPDDYEQLTIDMVREWRELFKDDVMFMFARLPYFRGETWEKPSDAWDRLRDAQLRACDKIDNCVLVELYDLGQYNEIHMQNKKEAAKRFYGEYIKVRNTSERGK